MGDVERARHERRRLWRNAVARCDISVAKDAAKLLLAQGKPVSLHVFYPLYNAMVIAYGRPFTENEGQGRISEDWPKFSDPALGRTHRHLIDDRHRLVAHSDGALRTVVVLPPGKPDPHAGPAFDYWSVSVRNLARPHEFVERVVAVCDEVLGQLCIEIDADLERLYAKSPHPPLEPFPLELDEDPPPVVPPTP